VEFAGIFKALGAETHLVFRQPLPLRGFDHDMREALAEALEAQGVILHPSARMAKLEADGEQRVLSFADGSSLTADVVFFATGRKPNTDGLGLEKAGVTVNQAGAVIVNHQLQTIQPHIYAIGDVIDHVNLTPVALGEGHALADTLFGGNPRELSLHNIPSAVFSTPPISTVGMTEEVAASMGPVDVYVSKFTPMRHNLSGRKRRSTMKLIVDQATQKIVGVHMLGEDSPEIVQGLAIAVVMGATKQDFDRTVGIHPTSAEEFVTMRTRTREAGVAKAAE
jgi:glutathione reductase (NADPH)